MSIDQENSGKPYRGRLHSCGASAVASRMSDPIYSPLPGVTSIRGLHLRQLGNGSVEGYLLVACGALALAAKTTATDVGSRVRPMNMAVQRALLMQPLQHMSVRDFAANGMTMRHLDFGRPHLTHRV